MDALLAGRYRLEEEIARGAIGTVWRAVDTVAGEPVAIKVIREETAEQPALVAAFRAEADILAEVDHPCVVRPRDYIARDGVHALVMDFVDGEDLRRRVLRHGPVPPAIAANVVAQIADALAHLHGQGIVHGDVKPGNLIVPADGSPVRLVDFGVARRLSDDPPTSIQATPEYVAPEVVNGAPPSAAADVYALGIVLFELLCGRSPYRGGGPLQVLRRHGTCTPVPPPGLPPVVWPVIEDCLAADPERRPEAKLVGARLRGVEPALEGAPAMPALGAEQITWWPRPAGAATAVAKVTWVPLRAAPVSPASMYVGRMVAIPVAGMDEQPELGAAYGTSSPWQRGTTSALPAPIGSAVVARRPSRRRVVAAGVGAVALVLGGVLGGLLLDGQSTGATVPLIPPASPAPSVTTSPSTMDKAPDTQGWPEIGSPMPTAPPVPAG
jgi:hypothetical protein